MYISRFRQDFPIFQHHPELLYLDSAATSQKPYPVIRALQRFYERENANIHRGLYRLADQTSRKYESVREKVAHFIKAASPQEIVYTSGTTEGVNLVANAFLQPRLKAGDEIIITAMEHHANLIPWQQMAIKAEAELKVIPVKSDGVLDFSALNHTLSNKTVMFACTHISNTLGTINPIGDLIKQVKSYRSDIPILIDAAQSIAHYELDVQQLDCDFLVFSGHKIFGPTGIGILYGKRRHLLGMEPLRYGGDMIEQVSFARTTFARIPHRFEAGTTNIAGVIGLGAAIDYISQLDHCLIREELENLCQLAQRELEKIPGLRIIGQAPRKSSILSFILDQAHPHDIASFLGAENIAVRAGHHCTQPLMDELGLPGTVRASFSIYNTEKEIQRLVQAVAEVAQFFA